MERNNFDSQHSMLPPLDLGAPWMPDVVAAKMVQIHEEISPSTTSTLQRRNAIRCPAGNMTMIEREKESCSLKRTNAVRRKRANTGATELSADSMTETEASVNPARTKESGHSEGPVHAIGGPQTNVSVRPSRFTEHLLDDEAKSHNGVARAISKMKAGLKDMLR